MPRTILLDNDPEKRAAYDALGQRLSHRNGDSVTLCYEIGDGYLGVRLESGDTSYAHT